MKPLQLAVVFSFVLLITNCVHIPTSYYSSSLTSSSQNDNMAASLFSSNRTLVKQHSSKRQIYSKAVTGYSAIALPPNSITTFSLRTYCMASSKPAPKQGEKMRLVPTSNVINEELVPLYQALMKYSHSNPHRHSQIQRIVWNITNTCLSSEFQSLKLQSSDQQLINSIYPQGLYLVQGQCAIGQAKNKIFSGVFNILQQQIPVELSQIQRMVNKSQYPVETLLSHLESRPISTPIPQDNSDYTLLAQGVAVHTRHQGGANRSEITLLNTNDTNYTFFPENYVLKSTRDTQPLGIGGIKEITQTGEETVPSQSYPNEDACLNPNPLC